MTSSKNSVKQTARPGCMTVYATTLLLGGVITAFSMLSLFSLEGFSQTAVSLGIVALFLLSTGFNLWYMHKWAWWIVVISISISFALNLINLVASLSLALVLSWPSLIGMVDPSGSVIIGAIIKALLPASTSAVILYWFIGNRHLFEGISSRYSIYSSS